LHSVSLSNAFPLNKNAYNMKRKVWFGAACLLLAVAATSCEDLGGCEVCKMVTRSSSGDITSSGSDTEYCGAELAKIKVTPAVTNPVTGSVTDYECR
jgi:hypothetical protein